MGVVVYIHCDRPRDSKGNENCVYDFQKRRGGIMNRK